MRHCQENTSGTHGRLDNGDVRQLQPARRIDWALEPLRLGQNLLDSGCELISFAEDHEEGDRLTTETEQLGARITG